MGGAVRLGWLTGRLWLGAFACAGVGGSRALGARDPAAPAPAPTHPLDAFSPAEYEQAMTYEALIRLTPPGAVERWTLVPGVQPPLSTWDAEKAKELVRRDERWLAALRRRGVDDPDHIYCDTRAMGPSPAPQLQSHRRVKTLFSFKGDTTSLYARPVEGLIAFIDLIPFLQTLSVWNVR